MICARVLLALTLSLAATNAAAETSAPLATRTVQLAQTGQHWLIGTWVWDSEWGPIVMIVTGVGADGQPKGTIENKRSNWHRVLATKASAAEVAVTVSATNMKLFFRSGETTPNYDLNFSGNSLSGTYWAPGRAGAITRSVNFVKR